jgi:hypothetical protein
MRLPSSEILHQMKSALASKTGKIPGGLLASECALMVKDQRAFDRWQTQRQTGLQTQGSHVPPLPSQRHRCGRRGHAGCACQIHSRSTGNRPSTSPAVPPFPSHMFPPFDTQRRTKHLRHPKTRSWISLPSRRHLLSFRPNRA